MKPLPTFTEADLAIDLANTLRIGFREKNDKARFEELVAKRRFEERCELVPTIDMLRQLGRRGRRLIGAVLLYDELVSITGNLHDVEADTIAQLSAEYGGLKPSRFQAILELKTAYLRAMWPEDYPAILVPKGEANPYYAMVRTDLEAGAVFREVDARVALEALTQDVVTDIIVSIPDIIPPEEVLTCRFVIEILNFCGGRWPGVATILLKEIAFDGNGRPLMIYITLPGYKGKRRAHLGLNQACAEALMALLAKQAKRAGCPDVKTYVAKNPEKLLLPDPRFKSKTAENEGGLAINAEQDEEVGLQLTTLNSWFDKLGTRHLGRVLCRRHFRITSFTRDASEGVPVAELQANKGQVADGRSTFPYVQFRIEHLLTELNRFAPMIQLPRCQCGNPLSDPSRRCPACFATPFATLDPGERRTAALRRAGEIAYEVRSHWRPHDIPK